MPVATHFISTPRAVTGGLTGAQRKLGVAAGALGQLRAMPGAAAKRPCSQKWCCGVLFVCFFSSPEDMLIDF